MNMSVKSFLFGNHEGAKPTVSIEIQLFQRDNEFYIAYVAISEDKKKAGTANVEKGKVKDYLLSRISMLSESII